MMLLVALVTCVGTNILYLRISNLFPSLTVSFTMLLQPLFGTFFIYILKQQYLPGGVTFAGMLLVIPALIMLRQELKNDEITNIEFNSEHSINHSPSKIAQTPLLGKKADFLI